MANHVAKKPRLAIHRHPLGIKPLGNILLNGNTMETRLKGLGRYLAVLPDEVLLHIIQEVDDAWDLLHLSHTCKSLFAYCWYDELWKYKLHQSERTVDKWHGSWRRTYWEMSQDTEATVDVTDLVFSDLLFRPFQCTEIDYESILKPQVSPIPVLDSITEEQFNEKWVGKPFILKSEKISSWSRKELVEKYAEHIFNQEYMSWPLRVYNQYMDQNHDESPLYLFDCGETTKTLNYKVPLEEIFDWKDYFKLLGDMRPDYRWLIVGPARSGSVFHKDPNGTSAWNAVITGEKYWIMFPPNNPPPGVSTDSDQAEVTQPISVAEWFLSGFYKQTLHEEGRDFLQGITEPGQVMYVPAGWWHMVVNLKESIAMTGNFVPEKKLPEVLDFLKNRPSHISGIKDNYDCEQVHDIFFKQLEAEFPEVAKWASNELAKLEKGGKWQQVVENKDAGFSFGFACEDD